MESSSVGSKPKEAVLPEEAILERLRSHPTVRSARVLPATSKTRLGLQCTLWCKGCAVRSNGVENVQWVFEFGDAGDDKGSFEQSFSLAPRSWKDYKGTRFYDGESALTVKRWFHRTDDDPTGCTFVEWDPKEDPAPGSPQYLYGCGGMCGSMHVHTQRALARAHECA